MKANALAKYLILLAFFYVMAHDGDGSRWKEYGPYSSWSECEQSSTSSRLTKIGSECYYVEGRNTAEDNLPYSGEVGAP